MNEDNKGGVGYSWFTIELYTAGVFDCPPVLTLEPMPMVRAQTVPLGDMEIILDALPGPLVAIAPLAELDLSYLSLAAITIEARRCPNPMANIQGDTFRYTVTFTDDEGYPTDVVDGRFRIYRGAKETSSVLYEQPLGEAEKQSDGFYAVEYTFNPQFGPATYTIEFSGWVRGLYRVARKTVTTQWAT